MSKNVVPANVAADQSPLYDSRQSKVVSDFYIHDDLRNQVLTASAAPYIVGQHVVLSARSRSGRILKNVNWILNATSPLVSSYPFPQPSQFASPPASLAVVLAPATPSATAVAFYPVSSMPILITAEATSGPSPASTTISLPVISPTEQATSAAALPWSVDLNYAFKSNPLPAAYIHLGGNTMASQGFNVQFNVTDDSQTAPASYAEIQLILSCDELDDMTKSKSSYFGTKGPIGVLDTLDGLVESFTGIDTAPNSFVVLFPDSPAFPLRDIATDQGSAYSSAAFQTILMYRYGVDSDPNAPNIWVPLPNAESWQWGGFAAYNVFDSSNTWEAAATPSPATSFSSSINLEPVWSYVYPFYGTLKSDLVKKCQTGAGS